MFNCYLHEKRSHTAAASSRKQLQQSKLAEQDEKLRNELALKYKHRLDQELVKVPLTQLALNSSASARIKESPTSKLLGEAKFRIQGCRTTLERLEQSAQERALLDTSASHTPVFLLRPRRKELEIGQPIRFGVKTQAERLTEAVRSQCSYTPEPGRMYPPVDTRAQSASRALMPEYHNKTHYKTILSLEMNLHSWQQGSDSAGPKEQEIRDRLRQEKLGKVDMQPSKVKPVILKQPVDVNLSLIDNIRKAPSTENLVLTHEQKTRLTEEIVRKSELRAVRNHQVTPLRSRIGSSPTTYHSGFLHQKSLSPAHRTEKK